MTHRITRRLFGQRAAGLALIAPALGADAPDILALPAEEPDPIDAFDIVIQGYGLDGRDLTVEVRRFAPADARRIRAHRANHPSVRTAPDGSVVSIRTFLEAEGTEPEEVEVERGGYR